MRIGDKFNGRYIIIKKLGWGHFSTVWLCYDKKHSLSSSSSHSDCDYSMFTALKIQKSASHYYEAALDEIEILNFIKSKFNQEDVQKEYRSYTSSNPINGHINDDDTMQGSNSRLIPLDSTNIPCVVALHDNFEHMGPNGKHVCMTFEILGENLLSLIKKYNYKGE